MQENGKSASKFCGFPQAYLLTGNTQLFKKALTLQEGIEVECVLQIYKLTGNQIQNFLDIKQDVV